MMRQMATLYLSAVCLLLVVTTCSADEEKEYIAKLVNIAAEDFVKGPNDKPSSRIIEPVWPKFDCPVIRSEPRPTSVHALRPADIDVVFAYGDSLTAGNGLGAKWVGGVALENRGESWCIGGDGSYEEEFVTLPNILKLYNPELKGWSRCSSGRFDYKYAWMNAAMPGATSKHMPEQSDDIVNRIINDQRVDADQDWKMASLLIGGNDLCAVCKNSDYCPEPYAARIEKAVEILYNKTTRMFINLVPMFDVAPLNDMARNPFCRFMQNQFCNCAVNTTYREQLRNIQLGYYNEMVKIVESGKYEREDFTVVIQPYMRDLIPPYDPEMPGDYDTSFLSHECFHPSRQFHRVMGFGLYSSMMVPYGQKIFEIDHSVTSPPFYCPSDEHPYIFTKQNSPTTYTTTTAPGMLTPPPLEIPSGQLLCPELYPTTTTAAP